jgi:hypothetical protein
MSNDLRENSKPGLLGVARERKGNNQSAQQWLF